VAKVAAEKKVDFPTLGLPTIPMSMFSPTLHKVAEVKMIARRPPKTVLPAVDNCVLVTLKKRRNSATVSALFG
jgi:hypothetical protein